MTIKWKLIPLKVKIKMLLVSKISLDEKIEEEKIEDKKVHDESVLDESVYLSPNGSFDDEEKKEEKEEEIENKMAENDDLEPQVDKTEQEEILSDDMNELQVGFCLYFILVRKFLNEQNFILECNRC